MASPKLDGFPVLPVTGKAATCVQTRGVAAFVSQTVKSEAETEDLILKGDNALQLPCHN
jgi:hypothetical protein